MKVSKIILLFIVVITANVYAQTVEIRKLTISCDGGKVPPVLAKEIAAIRVDSTIVLPAAEGDKRIDTANSLWRQDPCAPNTTWKTDNSSRIKAKASSSSSVKSSSSSSSVSSVSPPMPPVATLSTLTMNRPVKFVDGSDLVLGDIDHYELRRLGRIEKIESTGDVVSYSTTAPTAGEVWEVRVMAANKLYSDYVKVE